MNDDSTFRKIFANKKQDKDFNKKLYDSDIIQELHERINELEDRLDKLDNKEQEHKFGI